MLEKNQQTIFDTILRLWRFLRYPKMIYCCLDITKPTPKLADKIKIEWQSLSNHEKFNISEVIL